MEKHGQKSGRCLQVQISSILRDWLAEGCLVMQWGAAALCVASPAQNLVLSEMYIVSADNNIMSSRKGFVIMVT
jgi:hypothetical protein